MSNPQDTNRRDFLKTSAAVTSAAFLAGGVHAAGSDEIRVGVIGCGGRGSGAAEDVLEAAPNVSIVALGDPFEHRTKGLVTRLDNFVNGKKNVHKNKVDVAGRIYNDLDAYKKVIETPGVNYIILATPPGFRPIHLEAAVAAGKNIFTEKPVAVDGPGIRKVYDAYKSAVDKKLGIAAGTQRRHQKGYQETMKHVHDGEFGEFRGGSCYWNQGVLWANPRQDGDTDLKYQLRNWYNFLWLCGDHIVEQHVHNIDVINWASQAHPKSAIGMGYRTRNGTRTKDKAEFGHIFDFFAVDFEYPNGAHVVSMCRQIDGCDGRQGETMSFSKGHLETADHRMYRFTDLKGKSKQLFNHRTDNKPYIQEHTDLITSIRKGEPINELKNVADSTLSAIMGRMSAYTGKTITWEQTLNSKENTMPGNLAWDMKMNERQPANPGVTQYS